VEQTESLLAIAQIALGLAGFGGVFIALGQSAGVRHPADSYRLVLLLSTALSTLVLSLLPVALHFIGLPEPALWRLASALLAGLLATLIAVFGHLRRRNLEEIRSGEAAAVAALIWVVAGLVLAAEALNAAGSIGASPAGVFFAGLVFLVAFGSYLFARMLFLWRG